MTNSIKKKLLLKIKSFGYSLISLVHGKIEGVIDPNNHALVKIYNKIFDKVLTYRIFKIKNCRIYTDTVTDTAFIIGNKIIEGPSFQHRNPKNAPISENIVFLKGTPKFKRRVKGTVMSFLTGGGGNKNYWHWLFDVLPRLKIIEDEIKLEEINYFLFPETSQRYQTESLDILKIPQKKRISSKIFRHIFADLVISVDHPYVLKNDPSNEIQNIPNWIIKFLRKKFLTTKNNKKFPKKIYIDRRDAKSNHSHLRRILNEDDIKKTLKQNGYSIITLSDISFDDQVHLFNNATDIVGLHGAGFANLTFCDPGTKVLELKPSHAGEVIGNLAKKAKLNFSEISINPSSHSLNNQQGIISIPINLLEKKIS